MPRNATKAVETLAAYLTANLGTYVAEVNSEESLTGTKYALSGAREILKHRTGNEHRDSTFYVFDLDGRREQPRAGHTVVTCAVAFVIQAPNKKPADAEIKSRYMLDAVIRCIDAWSRNGVDGVGAYVEDFESGMGEVGEGSALVVGYSVGVAVHVFDE